MAFKWFKKSKQHQKEVETEERANRREDHPEKEKKGDSTISTAEVQDDKKKGADAEESEDEQSVQGVKKVESIDKPRDSVGFFSRIKQGLSKTREILTTDIDDLFTGKRKLDEDMLEELEELLITADIGVQASMDILENISRQSFNISGPDQLKDILKKEILALFDLQKHEPEPIESKPHVVMVIGVNGVGKTTTIGKLAAKTASAGNKAMIAAGDTFRAAAIEQLEIWAARSGADIIKHRENSDPAAVAYDGVEAALARDADVLFVDTAGRLHTKVNLMEELKKIKRALAKKIPEAPHEIILILDATTGQNALSQAEMFHAALGITGIAITKLDGTAKGGIVISICNTLDVPLRYIGVGETIDDLDVFDAEDYVNALF
jgi:fused signal recognition particle receptor